jgi:hypothetical protein
MLGTVTPALRIVGLLLREFPSSQPLLSPIPTLFYPVLPSLHCVLRVSLRGSRRQCLYTFYEIESRSTGKHAPSTEGRLLRGRRGPRCEVIARNALLGWHIRKILRDFEWSRNGSSPSRASLLHGFFLPALKVTYILAPKHNYHREHL